VLISVGAGRAVAIERGTPSASVGVTSVHSPLSTSNATADASPGLRRIVVFWDSSTYLATRPSLRGIRADVGEVQRDLFGKGEADSALVDHDVGRDDGGLRRKRGGGGAGVKPFALLEIKRTQNKRACVDEDFRRSTDGFGGFGYGKRV
jgi:hypothetical protein